MILMEKVVLVVHRNAGTLLYVYTLYYINNESLHHYWKEISAPDHSIPCQVKPALLYTPIGRLDQWGCAERGCTAQGADLQSNGASFGYHQ